MKAITPDGMTLGRFNETLRGQFQFIPHVRFRGERRTGRVHATPEAALPQWAKQMNAQIVSCAKQSEPEKTK